MRGRVAILAAAALAFAGAVAVRALPAPRVNDTAIVGDAMPPLLSAYGFFADAAKQVPAPGVTPYRLNTPLWSDGATKDRFLYLPAGAQAKAGGDNLLELPVGAALIKTFSFDNRHIETRVLLHRESGWVALPYLWNAEQTEARLALAGARVPVTTPAGEAIDYRVPNKNQCKECHGLSGAVTPIGPKARNLSKAWLTQMVAAKRLDRIPVGADVLPLWENRAKVPAALAARAYLDVNCAHCHQPNAGASNSGLDLRWQQSDPAAFGLMKLPVAAGRGSGSLLYDVVPGDPDHSILAYRLASAEPGVAMPELGKQSVDRDGVAIVRKWIGEMTR